jgi:hypothetical protein
MEIFVVLDGNKRYCSICRRKIVHKEIIVRTREPETPQYSQSKFKNWFAHTGCLIEKLKIVKMNFEAKMKLKKMSIELKRCVKGDKRSNP